MSRWMMLCRVFLVVVFVAVVVVLLGLDLGDSWRSWELGGSALPRLVEVEP